jgi:transcription elongation factor Elf1
MDDEVVAVEPEERYGDEIICPWCGAKMEDSWEMARHDDCGITDCELCGKRYEWTQIVDVNYSTIPVTPR